MWKADTLVQALRSCPYWTRCDLNSRAILGFDVFIRTFAIAFHTWNRREKAEQRQSRNIFKSASELVLPSRQPSIIYYITSTKEQFSTSAESNPGILSVSSTSSSMIGPENLHHPPDKKFKPIVHWSHAFSRVSGTLFIRVTRVL